MRFRITSVDYEPEDLQKQLPIEVDLIRELPGPDRPDYWLAKADKPVHWGDKKIEYLIVAARFVGVKLRPGVGRVVLNIAYVTDESLLDDDTLDFNKCAYVAIGSAEEIGDQS